MNVLVYCVHWYFATFVDNEPICTGRYYPHPSSLCCNFRAFATTTKQTYYDFHGHRTSQNVTRQYVGMLVCSAFLDFCIKIGPLESCLLYTTISPWILLQFSSYQWRLRPVCTWMGDRLGIQVAVDILHSFHFVTITLTESEPMDPAGGCLVRWCISTT